MAETITIQSNAEVVYRETDTIQSDTEVVYRETDTIQSNAHIRGTETIQSNAYIVPVELIYKIPKKIQATMRNVNTTPQTGGQGDGEFRIF